MGDYLLQNEEYKVDTSAMPITEYLHYLDDQNIDITSDSGQLLINDTSAITVSNFNRLKNRILNNKFMQSRGWLVANHREVYSYQFSQKGFYYIERNLMKRLMFIVVDLTRMKKLLQSRAGMKIFHFPKLITKQSLF